MLQLINELMAGSQEGETNTRTNKRTYNHQVTGTELRTPALLFFCHSSSKQNAKWHQSPEEKRKAKYTGYGKRVKGSSRRRGH